MDKKYEEIRETMLKNRVICILEFIDQELMDWMRTQVHLMVNKNPKKEIFLLIDTAGGSINQALFCVDSLKGIPTPKVGIVNGVCKSAGTILLSACEERHSFVSSRFVFHDSKLRFELGMFTNQEEAFREYTREVNTMKDFYFDILSKNFRITPEMLAEYKRIGELYNREYSAKEMYEVGVITKIIDKFPFYYPSKVPAG